VNTITLSHLPILKRLLSSYRSLTQSTWEPIADARLDPATGKAIAVWRMRRWRGGDYEFRDCTAQEAEEAEWERAIK